MQVAIDDTPGLTLLPGGGNVPDHAQQRLDTELEITAEEQVIQRRGLLYGQHIAVDIGVSLINLEDVAAALTELELKG